MRVFASRPPLFRWPGFYTKPSISHGGRVGKPPVWASYFADNRSKLPKNHSWLISRVQRVRQVRNHHGEVITSESGIGMPNN